VGDVEAAEQRTDLGMIPKSGHRFSEEIMPSQNKATNMIQPGWIILGMIPKSGHRFSEEIMPSQNKATNMIQPGWIIFGGMRSRL
jgi:hypothetical protein